MGPIRGGASGTFQAGLDPEDLGFSGEYYGAVLYAHTAAGHKVNVPLQGKDRPSFVLLSDAMDLWLQEFGLAKSITPVDRGHEGFGVSLTMDDGSQGVGLRSVGVGVSQAMPIILQCLMSKPGDLLLFEQPELHLHPALQNTMADFLLAFVKSNRQVVVETHSEHFVNRLRLRIALDETHETEKLVKILFAENDGSGSTYKESSIDTYGSLDGDWPEGFLEVASDTASELIQASIRKRKGNDLPIIPGSKNIDLTINDIYWSEELQIEHFMRSAVREKNKKSLTGPLTESEILEHKRIARLWAEYERLETNPENAFPIPTEQLIQIFKVIETEIAKMYCQEVLSGEEQKNMQSCHVSTGYGPGGQDPSSVEQIFIHVDELITIGELSEEFGGGDDLMLMDRVETDPFRSRIIHTAANKILIGLSSLQKVYELKDTTLEELVRDYDFDHKIYHKLPKRWTLGDLIRVWTIDLYEGLGPAAQMKFEDWVEETFGPYLDEFHMLLKLELFDTDENS